uniref:Uncharacterized protein n=1 Tax=Romanomermis culicivorax TaxID=13658 RepID=A0A915J596_ROMCU
MTVQCVQISAAPKTVPDDYDVTFTANEGMYELKNKKRRFRGIIELCSSPNATKMLMKISPIQQEDISYKLNMDCCPMLNKK